MSPSESPQLPQMPNAPPPPPMFGAIVGKKPGAKSMNPTFLGADTQPNKSNIGTATLLGRM